MGMLAGKERGVENSVTKNVVVSGVETKVRSEADTGECNEIFSV